MGCSGGPGDTFALHHDPAGDLTLGPDGVGGGQALPLTHDPAEPDGAITAKFPHLAGFQAFKIDPADLADVPAILKERLAVAATGDRGNLRDATSLQIPGVLDELFTYGGELGAVWDCAVPTLKLWAPTARSITLHVFDDSDPATLSATFSMSEDPVTGVWSVGGDESWSRKFYL